MSHEWERYATEVGASSEASYHDVRILSSLLHLLLSLKAYDSLVEGDVVEDRAEDVFAVWCRHGELHSL